MIQLISLPLCLPFCFNFFRIELSTRNHKMLLPNKKPLILAGRKAFSWYHPVLSNSDEMVDLRGLEPLTSSMPWMRSSNCATGPKRLVHNQKSAIDTHYMR